MGGERMHMCLNSGTNEWPKGRDSRGSRQLEKEKGKKKGRGRESSMLNEKAVMREPF